MSAATSRLPSSWYAAILPARAARPPLSGDVVTDVAVIGGGLAGLSTAFELANRGVRVAVLEAERVGFGASGRNGGFVSAGFAAGLADIERRAGRATADALFRLSMDGVDSVRRTVQRLVPEAVLGGGVMSLRRTPSGASVYGDQQVMQQRFGRALQVLSPAETRQLAKSARYYDGLIDATAFHIDPLRYVEALAAEIERCGGTIHEGSRAIGIERSAAGYAVQTAAGTLRATQIVHATSAYDRRLQPQLARAMQPIATYMLATEPLGNRARDAIATSAAIADDRRAGDYYRCLADGRILWGGRITTRQSPPQRLANLLKADMLAVYPQLGNPAIAHAWSGLMGYARHKMPLIGRFSPTEWYATAFGGHGLNTTASAGELIATAITSGDQRYRLFAAFAAEWAGGPAGKAAVQLTYWAMQARDRWDEVRAGEPLRS